MAQLTMVLLVLSAYLPLDGYKLVIAGLGGSGAGVGIDVPAVGVEAKRGVRAQRATAVAGTLGGQ